MNIKEPEVVIHPFEPIYNSSSRSLILGSFPSVISRKNDFYFSNPKNRFWKVLIEGVYLKEDGKDKESRIKFILDNNLALFDVISKCEIVSSDDSSIKKIIPNDLKSIVENSQIRNVFLNGKKAYEIYLKYFSDLDVKSYLLPSTSPANANWSYANLVKAYKIIKTETEKDI